MISTVFLDAIQKACLPGVWSKGVTLARADTVIQDQLKKDEAVFRVCGSDHPVSRRVTLWPEDEDWYCDCGDRNQVCAHVAAVAIAVRSGRVQSESLAEANLPKSVQIYYRLTSKDGTLLFERWIHKIDQTEEKLTDSLVSYVGGITSGRIQSLPIAATQADYAVDFILGTLNKNELDRNQWLRLIKPLSECSNVYLNQKAISVSSKPLSLRIRIVDEKEGFRLFLEKDSTITESFSHGLVLCGTTLRAIEHYSFTQAEREILSAGGRVFSFREAPFLVSEIIPSLQRKIPVEIESQKLPRVKHVPPRIVIKTEKDPVAQVLTVVPTLVYEDPIQKVNSNEIFIPDPSIEKSLTRKLQNELQLSIGQTVHFEGIAAVDFVLKLKHWETSGNGITAFSIFEPLSPKFEATSNGISLTFKSGETGKLVDAQRVFQAWAQNQSLVPLLDGGWAPLPKDWLEKYGDKISALLSQKDKTESLPTYRMIEVIELCDELGSSYPDSLRNLKQLLENIDTIQEAQLPKDLTVTLRKYQQVGVNWINFLLNAKMGALLADDMGLGKTLQTLCCIRGRTLIIAPTSVLYAWANQIQQFRPSLSLSIFHGASRKIDANAQITLTTYALLRMNQDIISSEKWDTIVLDEAHIIKNPESQTTKSAHSLHADYRIALTGTPIENRLTDLWSQLQFLNPGLLGSQETFQTQFVQPISNGNPEAAAQLRKRVKPFILRRLKKDVAPELPPRTEVVLYTELSENEREVYSSILASTRKEVLEKLDAGMNVFAVLELLLRLRQACCHSSLIPGQIASKSSKIDLLLETLNESISAGHRALVFSQWTSYLDLIEAQFKENKISYLRLDGSTKNRDQVIQQFQNPIGPSVLLISLKAGGVGVTLTAADHIFLMDPWWNPAIEDQAADRAHRIGQKNPVLIHRLIATNTIEDKILNLQKSKVELANIILSNASQAASITRDDLLFLLS